VHALGVVHRSLRSDGVLLDIHPQPENSLMEIWQDGRIERLGEIEQHQDRVDIEEARSRLRQEVRKELFAVRRRQFFELLGHYAAVDDWLDRWNDEGWNFSVDPGILDSARSLLAVGGGEFVIRETIRATSLIRLAGSRAPVEVDPGA
jgi:hypothetical protein